MSEPGLSIKESSPGGIILLELNGTLDAKTSPALNSKLKELIASGKNKIVCDLKDLSYISSAGIGTFLAHLKDVKKGGGEIRLASLRPEVRDVFDLLKFTLLFKIFQESDDALKGF